MSEESRDSAGGGPENQRAARRARVDYELSVDVHSGNAFYTGLIKDISAGGVFVATDTIHRVGERLRIRFRCPGMDSEIEVEGRVQWYRDPFSGSGLPPGVGVQFVDFPAEFAARLNAVISDRDVLVYEEDTSDPDHSWSD